MAVAGFAAIFTVAIFLTMAIVFFDMVMAPMGRRVFSMIMLPVPVKLMVAVSIVIPVIPAIVCRITAAPVIVPMPVSATVVDDTAAISGFLPVIFGLS